MGAREMMVTISDTTVSVPGGLYMLDSPTATDWQLIFGGEDAGYKDVRCLAQSSNGGVLYGGTRGCPCSETGTVLRCENPEADDTSMTWTALANTPSADYPFDFESPPGTGWNGDSANCWLTVVSALAVDPGDSDVVYVGLDRPGFMKQEGLYRYDGSSWEHLSEGEEFAGIGVTALEIDTTTTDSTLVIGTRGLDLYFMSTNDDPGPGECQTPPRASSRLRLLTVRSEVGGRTEIEFALDRPDCVKMKVFDVRGRLVYGRDVTIKKAGQCRLVWDGQSRPGRPCASGIYFLRLSTKDVKADRKFLLLR